MKKAAGGTEYIFVWEEGRKEGIGRMNSCVIGSKRGCKRRKEIEETCWIREVSRNEIQVAWHLYLGKGLWVCRQGSSGRWKKQGVLKDVSKGCKDIVTLGFFCCSHLGTFL